MALRGDKDRAKGRSRKDAAVRDDHLVGPAVEAVLDLVQRPPAVDDLAEHAPPRVHLGNLLQRDEEARPLDVVVLLAVHRDDAPLGVRQREVLRREGAARDVAALVPLRPEEDELCARARLRQLSHDLDADVQLVLAVAVDGAALPLFDAVLVHGQPQVRAPPDGPRLLDLPDVARLRAEVLEELEVLLELVGRELHEDVVDAGVSGPDEEVAHHRLELCALQAVRRLADLAGVVRVLSVHEADEVLHGLRNKVAVEPEQQAPGLLAPEVEVEVHLLGDLGLHALLHEERVPGLGLDALLLRAPLQDGVVPLPEHARPREGQDADLDARHLVDGPEALIPVNLVQDLPLDHKVLLEAAIVGLVPVAELQIRAPAGVHRVLAHSVDDVLRLHPIIDGEHHVDGPLVLGHLPEVHLVRVGRLTRGHLFTAVELHLLAALVDEPGDLGLVLRTDAALGNDGHVVNALGHGAALGVDDVALRAKCRRALTPRTRRASGPRCRRQDSPGHRNTSKACRTAVCHVDSGRHGPAPGAGLRAGSKTARGEASRQGEQEGSLRAAAAAERRGSRRGGEGERGGVPHAPTLRGRAQRQWRHAAGSGQK
mmetsp:Transcript_7750/g.20917  ORF Transcript_7750/g.20917 Transcript_7750/m.20917 type:complete len:598 (-) Transcript_7750:32-1825(-)